MPDASYHTAAVQGGAVTSTAYINQLQGLTKRNNTTNTVALLVKKLSSPSAKSQIASNNRNKRVP